MKISVPTNGEDKYEMLNKLFGNRDARQMTVKRRVEMIFIGGIAAGTFFAVGLANTIDAIFAPGPPAPSLLESVVMSAVGLVFCTAFVRLTFRTHGKAKDLLALAEPSGGQQG